MGIDFERTSWRRWNLCWALNNGRILEMKMRESTHNDRFTRTFCRHTEKQTPGEWSFPKRGKSPRVRVEPRLSSSHIEFSVPMILESTGQWACL